MTITIERMNDTGQQIPNPAGSDRAGQEIREASQRRFSICDQPAIAYRPGNLSKESLHRLPQNNRLLLHQAFLRRDAALGTGENFTLQSSLPLETLSAWRVQALRP